jgi:hypothetical protein
MKMRKSYSKPAPKIWLLSNFLIRCRCLDKYQNRDIFLGLGLLSIRRFCSKGTSPIFVLRNSLFVTCHLYVSKKLMKIVFLKL